MARGEGRKNRAEGTWGSVDKRATGYRARYVGPDGRRRVGPVLFPTKGEARAWLALQRADILKGQWMPEVVKPAEKQTLAAYADAWLPRRKVRGQPIRPRTHEHYRTLLDERILPKLGQLPVGSITRADVESWYDGLNPKTPTMNAHSYALLKGILGSAVEDGKATTNPCVIKGAGNAKRVSKTKPATLDELSELVTAMPVRYRAMVLLASWCAMRYGELIELRRGDVDLVHGTIAIRRAAARTKDGFQVGLPKSDAGIRDVAVPPHLMPMITDHLKQHADTGKDALLFPAVGGGHLQPSTFSRHYYRARAAAGRPDLRFHDLRHTGAVLAAGTGATLAELMSRLGHSTPQAALRYQHAAQGADKRIAAALSALVAS